MCQLFIIRLQKSMLKYYVSKNYRRAYDELEHLGLLSDCYAINYLTYQSYGRQLAGQSNSSISQHLEILASDKHTPIKVIKALLLVHALLQANATLESYDIFYSFMNHILGSSQSMAEKIKATQRNAERIRAKSAVYNGDLMKNEQIQHSKQIFLLLEKVVKPYVLYLQKIVSVFALYSLLIKTLYRSLATAEVWILLNLFKCGYSVTVNLPLIYAFKRKSFSPVGEGLAQAFSTDFNSFYPKLHRFIHQECSRIENRFNELERKCGEATAFKSGVQGLEDAVNILQEISQLNNELKALYGDPNERRRPNIVSPKLINLGDEQFQFILFLEKMRHSQGLGTEQTPKFYRTKSNQTEQNNQEAKPQLVPVFKDISNGEQFLCTFRKDRQGERQMHILPRYKKKQQN